MSDHKRRLALAAVIVASATAVSRLTGLGREVITAAIYGVDPSYNTFVSVSVIPQLVQQLFADAAISAAFVPVFTALLAKGERERAYRLAANLIGLIVVVVGAAVVVLALAAGPLTRWMYPELTGAPAGRGARRRSCSASSSRRSCSSRWPAPSAASCTPSSGSPCPPWSPSSGT